MIYKSAPTGNTHYIYHIYSLQSYWLHEQVANNRTKENKDSSNKYNEDKNIGNSGFTSTRTNLSPFTKDFRGVEHSNESLILSGTVSLDTVKKQTLKKKSRILSCCGFFDCSTFCPPKGRGPTPAVLQCRVNPWWSQSKLRTPTAQQKSN